MSYNNWSFSRDGLMTIKFNSNVRDLSRDLRRKQMNKFRSENNQGNMLLPDPGEDYSIFNSELNFDMNDTLNRNELIEILTIPTIKNILRTFRIPFRGAAQKPELVQILKNAVDAQPARINFVRQAHSQYIAQLRSARQVGNRNANETLLISNQYKYSKKDFDGMSFKEILRSLFESDYYLLFLFERVLKGKEIPNARVNTISNVQNKIRKAHAKNPLYTNEDKREIRDKFYQEASIKTDRILKHNSQIVLDLLFAPRRPFYINKKLYTVLGYHQENGPTQDPQQGLEIPGNSIYVMYPVIIHLELSDLPPDKVTDAELQKVSCHLRGEKIRKEWYNIWYRPDGYTPPKKLFERNYYKTLKKPILRGGSKHKKTRKTRKKIGGNPSPPAAIIEYLEYFPMQSKNQVDAFYEKIDHDWRQGANILQIFSKSAKQINNIQQLLDAVHEAKTTTFCNRKTGDGDCEDTSDRVMELLPEIPGGKYTVESLRFEYSEQEDLDDYDVTPDFVQNHGILIFYSTETKPWFKITENIIYR
jgi:hypothetical protein